MNRKEEIYLKGRCPCPQCSGTRLDDRLVEWILNFENSSGLKITITSGARCEYYNQQVGGYWNSPHLIDNNKIGHAIDFQIQGYKPIEIAFKVNNKGLKRIGIYPSHVHGDMIEPAPSRYWYTGSNGNPIYSKHINDLEEFLLQMKTEGRLRKDEIDILDNLIGNNTFSLNKKIKKRFNLP